MHTITDGVASEVLPDADSLQRREGVGVLARTIDPLMPDFPCPTCGAHLAVTQLHDPVCCIHCGTMTRSEALPLREDVLNDAEAARIPMTDEAVLTFLRQHFSGEESTYLCPSITGKRELGARAVHCAHLPSDERVLMLYDDTVFGTGDEGFVVTSQRLCWKNAQGRAHMVEWHQIDPDRMYADRRKLVLGAHAIQVTGSDSIVDACERAFHVLAFSAHGPSNVTRSGVALVESADSSAAFPQLTSETIPSMTAPAVERPSAHPTHRPSPGPTLESGIASSQEGGPETRREFTCWCCSAHVYPETPQCGRCGAWPAPQGWRRTA